MITSRGLGFGFCIAKVLAWRKNGVMGGGSQETFRKKIIAESSSMNAPARKGIFLLSKSIVH